MASPSDGQILRRRRLRVIWGTLFFVFGGGLTLLFASDHNDEWMAWGIGVFMVAGVLFIGGLFVVYTCPRCGESLGQDAIFSTDRVAKMVHLLMEPEECPRCGLGEND